ncbi:hypothetical protein Y032_0042g512 [Ancylostoma ceylanicum]|uniref:Uncharacterized protein n=1 Tax=Ancylostoma ceylanicum TaxID=53326 RepID=A0A016UEL1_9BILA|nr:hypothetical protein Y032_0042g512 [Ancylostoma ceylanicum]
MLEVYVEEEMEKQLLGEALEYFCKAVTAGNSPMQDEFVKKRGAEPTVTTVASTPRAHLDRGIVFKVQRRR